MKKIVIIAVLVLFVSQVNATRHLNFFNVSEKKISMFMPGWGVYTGYLLDSSGCWRHGTFYWSGDPSNYAFVYDGGCNNDNSCSVGFEDYCMSEAEFETFC